MLGPWGLLSISSDFSLSRPPPLIRVLVRQKVATCQQQRETLRQKNQRVAANTKTAAYKLQKENDVCDCLCG